MTISLPTNTPMTAQGPASETVVQATSLPADFIMTPAAATKLLDAAFASVFIEDLIAGVEAIVHRETGLHVFRDGRDGSFTDPAGELATLLEDAGFRAGS
ncbi:hypothetical protein ANMWB30_23730 [Arthrobacter sp. MWB30]|nr:hypothetical protein ANMWB30_23730 [Arthrobacter sp. MWB30]